MNRLAAIFLILLVLASGFGGYEAFLNQQQATHNQRQTIENQQLKQQLDETAKQLAIAQTERDQLQTELNVTNQKVKELEANITALRQQLEEKALASGSITVGLTFVWNAELPLDVTRLAQVVKYMNHEYWAPLKIYFFVFHSSSWTWIPLAYKCSGDWAWAEHAANLYPQRDIPVGIFLQSLDASCGCAQEGDPIAIAIDASGTLFSSTQTWNRGSSGVVASVAGVLLHETEHVFGISDKEIDEDRSREVIPLVWYSRLQANARRFQMPLPSS